MSKVLTPKLQPASGNFKSSPKAQKPLVIRCGLHGIFWKEPPKNTALPSTGIVNRSALPTGTARVCTPISPTTCCERVVQKKFTIPFVKSFAPYIKEHIEVYGADNHLRLTGKHETQSIDKFSYGVSDRGASIRIPIATVENNWKGWLEDRRPNSAADPYKVAARIIKDSKNRFGIRHGERSLNELFLSGRLVVV